MKKNIYLLTIVLMLANFADGQKIKGLAGFIKSGYIYAPNVRKTFEDANAENNYAFTNNFWSFGAEAYYLTGNIIITGDGNIGVQKINTWNDIRSSAVYEALYGKFGWIIAKDKNYWVYPSVGAGASVMLLTNYKETNSLSEITNTKKLVSPSVDLAVNADVLLSKLHWNEKYYCGWMLGIRAGYRLSARNDNWQDDNNLYKSSEMPPYTNNAFYVTFSIGGGDFEKK